MKKAMKEDEIRHRMKRLSKLQKKDTKEQIMREKLNKLSVYPSSTSSPSSPSSLIPLSPPSDVVVVSAMDDNNTTITMGDDEYDEEDTTNNEKVNTLKKKEEEEKREITKDEMESGIHYKMKQLRDTVMMEKDALQSPNRRTRVRSFPVQVDVKNSGIFPSKPGLRSTRASTGTSSTGGGDMNERTLYTDFFDSSKQGNDDASDISSVSRGL